MFKSFAWAGFCGLAGYDLFLMLQMGIKLTKGVSNRRLRCKDTLLQFMPLSGEAAMYTRLKGGEDAGVEAS